VELQISTGTPRRERLRKVLRGPDTDTALLHACDEAVLATLGIPGFFSGQLLFVSRRGLHKEIYVADPLFLRARQITTFKDICFKPSWSSDGKGIFFTSIKSKANFVYFMDLSSRKHRAVANFRGNNLSGVQSPASKKVAFILSATGNPELWLADGAGVRPRQLTRNNSNESGPCWSPDGRRMIITSDSSGKPQLYKVSLINGRLAKIPTEISRHCSAAAWNPRNPNRLAFAAAVAGGFQLAEYDFQRGKSRWLTAGSADALQPEWANDGRHIFFTERRGGASRLMIVDAGSDEAAAAPSPPPKAKPVKLHNEGYGNPSQPSFLYK
jgi:TolB protein